MGAHVDVAMDGSNLLVSMVRDVIDYPKPGVVFKDITPLLGDASAFARVLEDLVAPFVGRVDKVCVLEARGFLIGAPAALLLGAGIVPLRKPGKLPFTTWEESYDLEYGSDRIQMHTDALSADDRVLIIDDVIATGGTARAAIALVRRSGATLVGVAALMEVPELNGRAHLDDIVVHVVAQHST